MIHWKLPQCPHPRFHQQNIQLEAFFTTSPSILPFYSCIEHGRNRHLLRNKSFSGCLHSNESSSSTHIKPPKSDHHSRFLSQHIDRTQTIAQHKISSKLTSRQPKSCPTSPGRTATMAATQATTLTPPTARTTTRIQITAMEIMYMETTRTVATRIRTARMARMVTSLTTMEATGAFPPATMVLAGLDMADWGISDRGIRATCTTDAERGWRTGRRRIGTGVGG